MAEFSIRPANRQDVSLILSLIKELASYEELEDQVTATEEILNEWIFNLKKAEVLIGEVDGQAVGYALFFYNFSTFLGRAGIYIEDVFVRPEFRKNGYGKAFFKYIANIGKKSGYGRMEWSCLDWNRPSIEFYLSMGAEPMNDWTAYRLNSDLIKKLAEA